MDVQENRGEGGVRIWVSTFDFTSRLKGKNNKNAFYDQQEHTCTSHLLILPSEDRCTSLRIPQPTEILPAPRGEAILAKIRA